MPVVHTSSDIAAVLSKVNGCLFLTQHSTAAHWCERDQTSGEQSEPTSEHERDTFEVQGQSQHI